MVIVTLFMVVSFCCAFVCYGLRVYCCEFVVDCYWFVCIYCWYLFRLIVGCLRVAWYLVV